MNIDLAITGATLLTPDGERTATVLVADGNIAGIESPEIKIDADAQIDASGMHVLPGVIDIHCHIRAPAYPERGTVDSETLAAAAGGITTVFEMPITKPCCNSPTEVRRRREHFEQSARIDFGLYAAPLKLTQAGFDELVAEGIIGFKIFTIPAPPGRDDEFAGLAWPNEADQLKALQLAATTGLPIVVHAESAELLAAAEATAYATLDPAIASTHGASRPAIAEAIAVAKLLTMNIQAQAKLHIAHVTCAATLDVLRHFGGSSDFTAETCPQYLCYTEADVARAGVWGKVNPPIRQAADRDALWQALRDGTLQHVTTDHAGFSYAEKAAHAHNFLTAPPGHPGTETMLPVVLDGVARGRLTLTQAVALLSGNAANRFNLADRGQIVKGARADLVLVDLSAHTHVDISTLLTQARECACLHQGRSFQGQVCRTLLAGHTIWQADQSLPTTSPGRYVVPSTHRVAPTT